MATKRAKPKKGDAGLVRLPIRWGAADDMPTIYANQMQITHAGPEFYLVFGELVPPLANSIQGMPEAAIVNPKIRIAISREAMLEIAQAIGTNVRTFIGKVEAIQGGDDK